MASADHIYGSQTKLYPYLKRMMDFAGSLFLIITLSPIFLALMILIRLDGGKAIFGHERVGMNGSKFLCYKFRTMVPNAENVLNELLSSCEASREEWEKSYKLKNDPRITKIGGFLRRTSLDELPQLFNTLKGEMSLVGPRPITADELKFYQDRTELYQSVRPGMTGLWQVSGRSNESYESRVAMDTNYVVTHNLLIDIKILLKTILVVMRSEGAY